jgi:hypothetical protein
MRSPLVSYIHSWSGGLCLCFNVHAGRPPSLNFFPGGGEESDKGKKTRKACTSVVLVSAFPLGWEYLFIINPLFSDNIDIS